MQKETKNRMKNYIIRINEVTHYPPERKKRRKKQRRIYDFRNTHSYGL